ncbi:MULTISPECIES: (d)CMP kinase [Bacillaceae]|uniref:Cytidylate kinase n=1 Tax=Alkalicoccobacillus plakortidis TaxID=444060 RepID=A0A9D5HZJ1_9BACI|nr:MULTISPECIES: (d)CMP kinase [Bacillaceae]KQL51817.1 cytidylate kinase [Alkalicoccobacillus plakortidis]
MTSFNVAIDGPAGAGKSTVAKQVAEKLGFLYIDTGAMYRALTQAALAREIDVKDEEALIQLLRNSNLELAPSSTGTTVYWDGEDITEDIRSNKVNQTVSLVSSYKQIRLYMMEKQQKLASEKNAVLDGRDTGTHVLPDADVKVFLTASVEERAKRRHTEQLNKGLTSDLEAIKRDIEKRDELDSNRAFAPLKQADDAEVLDTTCMDINQVTDAILDLVKEHSV